MTYRIALVLSASALLGACATAQENPNYQFSSKYDPGTQLAQAPLPVTPEVTAAIYEPAQPVEAYPQPAVSETELAFDAATMDGTPGYAVFAEEAALPVPVEQAGQGVPVAYDYSQNVIVAGADTAIAPTVTRQLGGWQSYTVVPGDTVYSLARRNCVGISDITERNGIGPDYAISIGQRISVPGSRC